MNRREFLQCAAVLVTGTAASSALGLSTEQQAFISARKNYVIQPVNLFRADQRQLCSAIIDLIIPRTDTPGAIDADVPKYVELIVRDWYTEGERRHFMEGLSQFQQQLALRHGVAFESLDHTAQIEFLEELEAEASNSSWYTRGNVFRDIVPDAPFICQIKELTVYGFFGSEVGGKQVLRYNPMPMAFEGDIPLNENDSSWAPN